MALTVDKLAKALGAVVVAGEGGRREVRGVYACDVLGRALARAEADCAWVTVVGHVNTIAVAVQREVACVVVADGATVDANALEAAVREGVPVLTTGITSADAVARIQAAMKSDAKSMVDDITRFIFVEDEPRQADIIFAPGSADPSIPERAAELYRDGYAPLVLPAGGVSVKLGKFAGVKKKADVYNKDYRTECEFYCDVLQQSGVPESAILQENQSGHTRDNAFFSRKAADAAGLSIRKAIICCKGFHARRCLMLYQMAFPEAELCVVAVEGYGVNRHNWHESEYGVDRVLGELSRCGNQFVPDIKRHLGLH